MKKRNFLFSAVLAGALLVTACGSQEYDGGAKTAGEVTPQYETETQAETEAVKTTQETAAETVSETKAQTGETASQAASAVTEEEAKKIALDDAGVSESNVTRIRMKREYDDGRELYSVEFYVDAEEYDYDIEISSGKIISKDFDIDDDFKAGSGGQSSQNDIISEDEAVAIVLERISGASADDVWIQLDRDDGKTYYEGDVYYDNKEYEFEIDAATGQVTDWSEEAMGR